MQSRNVVLEEMEDGEIELKEMMKKANSSLELTEEDVLDEEGSDVDDTPDNTPFPYRPSFFLVLMTFSEGLALSFYFPFLFFQVEWLGISKKDVGYYVGALTMIFFLAQFFTNMFSGRLSDHIGRKPVVLVNFFANSVCIIAWGFCSIFPLVMVVRFIQGLLNGAVPIVKSYVRDVSTEGNMARLYSLRSVGYLVGMVIGPLIGGHFSRPSRTWPEAFPPSSIFSQFPFLLPCLVIGILNFITFLLCLVFMKESLLNTPPLFVGLRRFLISVGWGKVFMIQENDDTIGTEIKLDEERGQSITELRVEEQEEQEGRGGSVVPPSSPPKNENMMLRLLKEPFIAFAVGSYMLFSVVHLIFQEVFALWVVLPIAERGLGFQESDTGNCLAVAALSSAAFALFLFPPLVRLLGNLLFWRIAVIVAVPLYLFLPLTSWLVRIEVSKTVVMGLLYFVLITQKIHSSISFSTINLMITNLSPTDSVGTVSGVAASCAAFTRMVSPLFGGALFAATTQTHYNWPLGTATVFSLLSVFCVAIFILSFGLSEMANKRRETPLDLPAKTGDEEELVGLVENEDDEPENEKLNISEEEK